MLQAFKINTTFLLLSIFLLNNTCQAQLSREKKLDLNTVSLLVPDALKPRFPGTFTLNVPRGYKASVFYTGELSKGRFMTWGPDSCLYIANFSSGQVLALPDKDRDEVADTAIVAAKDVYGHDVKFFRNAMYVTLETKVEKLEDRDGDGYYETRSTFIDSVLKGNRRPPGGHTTRTLVFDSLNKRVFLSVGSSCNICREDNRAVIFVYDLDGKNRRLFATGTRNCIGLALHPVTGELWATNNGSDYHGDDTPPEWVSNIKDGGFYGYPFAYGDRRFYDFSKHEDYAQILPLTAADSAQVRSMQVAAGHLRAHSALMAIEFANASFPAEFRNGCFVACRGSFDPKLGRGYNILFLTSKKNKITGVHVFAEGFSDADRKPWARPVGLAADLRGNLYMSSDGLQQFVLVLSPSK